MADQHQQPEALAELLASDFLDTFLSGSAYNRDNITQLVKLAVSEDSRVAKRAGRVFFTSLVEKLADSFEPVGVAAYNRAFSQLIQACRQTTQGRPVDERLDDFGLGTEEDLRVRAESLRRVKPLADTGVISRKLRHVVVLSRVTLGADVAITSVILDRLKQLFPQASITLVGSRKSSQLFGGDPRLSFRELDYPKSATATDRLLAWLQLLDSVREIASGDDYLVVDPDSRLTQLGLLPLIGAPAGVGPPHQEKGCYLFFPSREYRHDSSSSLPELASTWLDEVFGVSSRNHPYVAVTRADAESARQLISLLRREADPVVTVNFGVGENETKRVGDDFERKLVSALLRDGATVVLDKGAGAEEAQRAESIVAAARQTRCELRVTELDEASISRLLEANRLESQVLVWNGGIGMLAAFTAESDLYVGYDSAGQHIAAALGVPSIDVFAGFSSRRVLDRWRPTGRNESRVVVVESNQPSDAILVETLHYARQLLVGGRNRFSVIRGLEGERE